MSNSDVGLHETEVCEEVAHVLDPLVEDGLEVYFSFSDRILKIDIGSLVHINRSYTLLLGS